MATGEKPGLLHSCRQRCHSEEIYFFLAFKTVTNAFAALVDSDRPVSRVSAPRYAY